MKGGETMLPERLIRRDDAAADVRQIVYCGSGRVTVLSARLLRIEYVPSGDFEDHGTQSVVCRRFPGTAFQSERNGDALRVTTDSLELVWPDTAKPDGLTVTVRDMPGMPVWRFGDEPHTLGGTCRTLDGYPVESDGALGEGVCSRGGFAVLDDSAGLIVTDDGWLAQRPTGAVDLYFFGFGHDYIAATQALYGLTGRPPMLPNYVYGNWWSRFYRYSEESYLALMDRFREEDIPFTVAVIDMDWHWSGSGFGKDWRQLWTGYSWNRELFPDYRRFLRGLHARGLHPALNLHPARGIQDHEDLYPEMAKARGIDTATKKAVDFAPADPDFWDPYLSIVHHPYEAEGVDFWWMDWQQGKTTDMPGLDPLWALDHFHSLDCAREEIREKKRPMFFSRYAGPGSQRFYVGFSGDTYIRWDALDYEPYFTATAANIGYPFWSHDIGGFQQGKRDDELYVRWIQFGVFSPISRLHCSNDPFLGKEPWNYGPQAEKIAKSFLRLRHQLFPYLYTMGRRTHTDGRALCEPVYYRYPEEDGAYAHRNAYFFGSQMLVCPVTRPVDRLTLLAETPLWLPPGRWIDRQSGVLYTGGRTITAYRALEAMPVFCPAGAIVPLRGRNAGENDLSAAEQMEIEVFAGADGSFVLYEDEGDNERYRDGHFVQTELRWQWTEEKAVLTICAAHGDTDLIPRKRNYTLRFRAMPAGVDLAVHCGTDAINSDAVYEEKTDTLTVHLHQVPTDTDTVVELTADRLRPTDEGSRRTALFTILLHAQTQNVPKTEMWQAVSNDRLFPKERLAKLEKFREQEPMLIAALEEVLLASGALAR